MPALRTCSCRRRTLARNADQDERVDGKSIMGMMMLAAERGTELELEAAGPDADAMLRALGDLVAAGFGEE